MMSKIIIKGAKVLRAEGAVEVADILIEGDRIAKIGSTVKKNLRRRGWSMRIRMRR